MLDEIIVWLVFMKDVVWIVSAGEGDGVASEYL